MVKTLGDNLKRETRYEVDATLVMMAAAGEIKLEVRTQGEGEVA